MLSYLTVTHSGSTFTAITREAVRILNVEPEWVTVVIDEYSRDNWATGGELHSIKFGTGFGKQSADGN